MITTVYGDTDSLYISYKDLIDTIEGSEKMTLDEKLKIILKINLDFLDKHNEDHLREYFLSRHARENTAGLEAFELETVNKVVYGFVKLRNAMDKFSYGKMEKCTI